MIVRIPVSITGPALPTPGMNIWHARIGDGDGVQEDDINQVAGWLNVFYGDISGLYPAGNTISFDGEATEIGTATPQTLPQGAGWTVAGTGAADGLPAADCLMVSWRTALATRRGRGRTFIGPVVKSAAEGNGTPEESNRSALQNAVDDLVATSAAAQPGGKAIGIWSPADAVLRDVLSGNVPNRFGVLRSRRD